MKFHVKLYKFIWNKMLCKTFSVHSLYCLWYLVNVCFLHFVYFCQNDIDDEYNRELEEVRDMLEEYWNRRQLA